MSETPDLYREEIINSIRRGYEYIRERSYEELIKDDSIFSKIARFTPLDQFEAGDDLEEHYRIWCNSVGVWLTVKVEEEHRYVLLARQTERGKDGAEVWEIPSGHTEPERDKDAYWSAVRELMEETGIELGPNDLRPLTVIRKDNPHKGALLFRATVEKEEICKLLGEVVEARGGVNIYVPPEGVDRAEIDGLALVPVSLGMVVGENPDEVPELLARSRYLGASKRGFVGLKNAKFLAQDMF